MVIPATLVKTSSCTVIRILTNPNGLKTRGAQQGLHDYAILFCFFSQCLQLFRRCLRRSNVEMKVDAFKSDRHIFCDAKRAPKIQISLDRDFNSFGRDAHRRSHHLTGDLRASRQRSKQEIAGTRAAPGASNTFVSLGLVDRAPDIDRA
jgi:hypothetical protein